MIDESDFGDIFSSLKNTPKSLMQESMESALSILAPPETSKFAKYRHDARGYFVDVLKTKYLSDAQHKILELVSTPVNDTWKRKLAIGASVNYGKSFMGGGLTNWYFDAWGPSCIVKTTAPSQQSVVDLLWKEVRIQRSRADAKWGIGAQDFIGPQSPLMRRAPDWWAHGYTAAKGESWKGRHVENMCFLFDEACHDDQTDVMTEHGWRRFCDLDGTERLMTMNPDTHVAEFMLPEKIVKKPYAGKMLEYTSQRGSNWCVTPDHEMYWQHRYKKIGAEKSCGSKWKRSSMSYLKYKHTPVYMLRSIKWEMSDQEFFVLPAAQTHAKSFDDREFPMDDWLRFMGWYFSEGCLLHGGPKGERKVYGIGITQKNKESLDEIESLLTRLGFLTKRYPSGRSGCFQVQIHEMHVSRWLASFGGNCIDKTIPDFVRNLSVRQINIFLDVFLEGDGYTKKSQDVFYTSSEKMANILNELILKTGTDSSIFKRPLAGKAANFGTHIGVSSVDGYVVSRSHNGKTTKYFKRNLREIDYEGYVWCARLPKYHLLFTRRNGRSLWSGNCGLVDMYFNCSHLWVCLYNPTDTSSPMYQEINKMDSDWTVIELSALGHPNVLAELRGEPAPIPAAISMDQVEAGIKDDCEQIDAEDMIATDFEWKGKYFRPGSDFEGNFLGRWPSSDDSAIWSDALWKSITKPLTWREVQIHPDYIPAIGVDVAYLGFAKTCIHVSWGDYSVHHESKGGQDEMRTVGRIIEIAEEWADKCNKAREKFDHPKITGKSIPLKIDNTGGGGGIPSRLREQGYNVFGLGAAEKAMNQKKYPNRRSELWFMTRDRAKLGKLHLGLLNPKILIEICKQAKAPLWTLNSCGQREVEKKEMTERRLGTSIDSIDAMNLSWYHIEYRTAEILTVETSGFIERAQAEREQERVQTQRSGVWRAGRQGRRGLFGGNR